MSEFDDIADDVMMNLNLQTTLALPGSRETILHFYEAVQKEFPSMTSFYQRETGEFVLEGDRESGSYSWLELSSHRMAAGSFNPTSVEEGHRLYTWLLERSVYFLGVSDLDIECVDVLFGFNLDYDGNRDALVAEALLEGSPLGNLARTGSAKAIEFEPSMVITLDEGCYVQGRLSIETHGGGLGVRTGEYEAEPISIYFTVRRYPRPGKPFRLMELFAKQCSTCEDLTRRLVIPNIINPISTAISSGGER